MAEARRGKSDKKNGAKGARILVVEARFYDDIADALLAGATKAHESARGLMDLSVSRQVPIGNGIITVDNDKQAWARARPEEQDKGGDAARAALAVVALKRQIGKK